MSLGSPFLYYSHIEVVLGLISQETTRLNLEVNRVNTDNYLT